MQIKNKSIHIIARLDMGGSAQNTLLTCSGLAEKYELMLAHGLSLESNMTDQEKWIVEKQIKNAERCGVKVISLPSLVRRIDPLQDLKAFFFLLKLFITEKPDIVHTHSSKAGILGRWAAKIAGAPTIVHTTHGHVFYGHFGPLTSRFFLLIERISARFTDRMVALTEGEKNDYIAFSLTRARKIVTIHSGVDIDRFVQARIDDKEKKKSLGLKPNSIVVGTVGWLLPIKGPMILLKAMEIVWQSNSDVQLVFVGKGDLENELRAELRRMGNQDRTLLLGWRDDIPEIMQILDIFVLPSLNEGMGRVLVEAMAVAKPVVASRVGGIPDLVKHGKNGFLVEPGDAEGLSQAILTLLNDELMRREFGKNGRAIAPDFSLERMIEKIDSLYYSLIRDTEISK
ncbi:MAG: glycosyltransferase family 4 protein [Deltaproteobacteria bacterium]|nr:glycosyltransferase family 4 protein [Deltaproteobacteria bacterium]